MVSFTQPLDFSPKRRPCLWEEFSSWQVWWRASCVWYPVVLVAPAAYLSLQSFGSTWDLCWGPQVWPERWVLTISPWKFMRRDYPKSKGNALENGIHIRLQRWLVWSILGVSLLNFGGISLVWVVMEGCFWRGMIAIENRVNFEKVCWWVQNATDLKCLENSWNDFPKGISKHELGRVSNWWIPCNPPTMPCKRLVYPLMGVCGGYP